MVQHDNSRERRSAGYVRVSSGNSPSEAQEGIAAQKEVIERFAEEHGYEIVGWYVDGGSPGGDVPTGSDDDPSALQELLSDAGSPERNFGTILVSSVSRLSRNIVEFHTIKSEFQKCGVTVVSVAEPVVDASTERFVLGLIETLNEYQRELHSKATRRGIAAARRRRQGC